MIENINQPESLEVLEIFKNSTRYIIPIYQRNYAWGEEEIEQLLIDINDFHKDKDDSNYYLGNLIVDEKEPYVFHVIDGQQRLTTLFLLFKYLRIGNLNTDSLSFEARDKSNRTLNTEDFNNLLNSDSLDNYSSEIVEGYKIIKNFFENLTNISKNENKESKEDLKKDFIKKLDNIIIIRTQVPKNIDLNHYFEVMNTRGEQLELHEIAKERILNSIGSDGNNDSNDVKIASMIWEACAQMDTYVQMNFSKEIRENLFGTNWNEFNHTDFDGLKYIPNNNEKLSLNNIFEYINSDNSKKDIEKSDKSNEENYKKLDTILHDLKNNKINNKKVKSINEEQKERFESIVSFPNFLLIVNEILELVKKNSDNTVEISNNTTLDDKKLLETLNNYLGDEKKVAEEDRRKKAKDFIFALLKYRFLFDNYIIKREYKGNNNDGEWSLARITDKNNYYYNNLCENEKINKQLTLLQATLRITYTSPQSMHWIAKTLKYIDDCLFKEKESQQNTNVSNHQYQIKVDDNKIGGEIIEFLEYYCKDEIKKTNFYKKSIDLNDDDLQKEELGYPYIERIVFSYLDYVLFKKANENSDNDKEKIFNKNENLINDIKKWKCPYRNSIEHFYPQNPINPNEKWEKDKPLDSFGNLALITVSGNSKFSNLSPQSKKDSYPDIIKQSPKLMIMASYCSNNEKWDEGKVIDHGAEMFGILKNGLLSKGTKQSNE